MLAELTVELRLRLATEACESVSALCESLGTENFFGLSDVV